MKQNKTMQIVTTALFAALTLVATLFIRVPLVIGYVNLGDVFVILSAFYLKKPYCIMSAAVGSALADILSGYVFYAPATLVIKGLMPIIFIMVLNRFKNKTSIAPLSLSAFCCEIIMPVGYFLYESILYSLEVRIAALAFNAVQGAVSAVIAVLLILILNKTKLIK